ncbi:MAG: hypothetical protein AAGC55_28490, partial [Myxococcota bacterium]
MRIGSDDVRQPNAQGIEFTSPLDMGEEETMAVTPTGHAAPRVHAGQGDLATSSAFAEIEAEFIADIGDATIHDQPLALADTDRQPPHGLALADTERQPPHGRRSAIAMADTAPNPPREELDASEQGPPQTLIRRGFSRPDSYPDVSPDWARKPLPWARDDTGSSRMAPPWRRPGGVLIGAAAAVLAALIVALLLLGGGDDDETEDTPADSKLADQAKSLLVAGNADAAIQLLRSGDIAADSRAQLILGHALMTAKQVAQGLLAYRTAVELDRALGRDQVLNLRLHDVFDGGDKDELGEALAVIRAALSEGSDNSADHPLVELLVAVGSTSEIPRSRQRARAAASDLGHGDRIDWLASYVLDLRQGRRCEERRKAVTRLRELGDVRAARPLRRAARDQDKHKRARGKNRCLRNAALSAATALGSKRPSQAWGRTIASPVGGPVMPPVKAASR